MRHRTLTALVAAALISSGCATWFDPPRQTHRASVVDYLYPKNEQPALKPSVPELHLPLRVGIAFVPGNLTGDLPEVERNNLLNRVKNAFSNRPYIDNIQVIPTTYLRSGGGFGNGYQSDMPGFEGKLTADEMTAVLDYIKSTWPEREAAMQRKVSGR